MNFLKKILAKKDKPENAYNDFWIWFQNNERDFFNVVSRQGDIEKEFFDKLSPKLNLLHDGFFYLTGMCAPNAVELVLTADGKIKNIVFVEELVKSAPKIEGWKFIALKPATDIKNVTINMGGYQFGAENLSFYSNEYAEHPDEIDITIVHKDFNYENKNIITNGTYIFLDNYLGELDFATTIDNLTVIGRSEAQEELVPIEKLKDFLIWRQKEFLEKYDGTRHNTKNDSYSMLEAELQNGNPLIAIINRDLLNWDRKASHPWILAVEIKYEGEKNTGMPDDATYKLLEEIENKALDELKDFGGCLNIGRQTADGIREIYFACDDFRKPSKVLQKIQNNYSHRIEINYDIYKDKYWQTFKRFDNN
ncbi:MAG TPA: DUF695 domain-containing protein [Mucilaginibacter sp.]|jgi:hypothetical protein